MSFGLRAFTANGIKSLDDSYVNYQLIQDGQITVPQTTTYGTNGQNAYGGTYTLTLNTPMSVSGTILSVNSTQMLPPYSLVKNSYGLLSAIEFLYDMNVPTVNYQLFGLINANLTNQYGISIYDASGRLGYDSRRPYMRVIDQVRVTVPTPPSLSSPYAVPSPVQFSHATASVAPYYALGNISGMGWLEYSIKDIIYGNLILGSAWCSGVVNVDASHGECVWHNYANLHLASQVYSGNYMYESITAPPYYDILVLDKAV